jgi:hypothetical protein
VLARKKDYQGEEASGISRGGFSTKIAFMPVSRKFSFTWVLNRSPRQISTHFQALRQKNAGNFRLTIADASAAYAVRCVLRACLVIGYSVIGLHRNQEATMALTSAEKQQRYRERRLGIHGTKERIQRRSWRILARTLSDEVPHVGHENVATEPRDQCVLAILAATRTQVAGAHARKRSPPVGLTVAIRALTKGR